MNQMSHCSEESFKENRPELNRLKTRGSEPPRQGESFGKCRHLPKLCLAHDPSIMGYKAAGVQKPDLQLQHGAVGAEQSSSPAR